MTVGNVCVEMRWLKLLQLGSGTSPPLAPFGTWPGHLPTSYSYPPDLPQADFFVLLFSGLPSSCHSLIIYLAKMWIISMEETKDLEIQISRVMINALSSVKTDRNFPSLFPFPHTSFLQQMFYEYSQRLRLDQWMKWSSILRCLHSNRWGKKT